MMKTKKKKKRPEIAEESIILVFKCNVFFQNK